MTLRAVLFALALSAVTAIAAAAGPAAKQRNVPDPSPRDFEFFEKKIRPLLHKHCFACHSAKAKTLRGGLRLDTRKGLMAGGDSGTVVVPAKPDESPLIDAVRYGPDSLQMPPSGKLPAADIALLETWVKRGAPFPKTADAGSPDKSGIDFAAGRKFWSFQPLQRKQPPAVRNRTRMRNRIDAFILSQLEKRKLEPSPPATRRTLIRRLSFDLTGLPPTPVEIEQFLTDRSPDAYERLVERLLASPRYGERWGRMWLDLARYTDVTAKWLENTAQAYLYRDWVVRAVNDDVPYDRFVMRQLATDRLPETGPEDMPALGFLGLSPTYWKELKLPAEIIKVIVADEWEERIDTVSRTFLGLTVACARCHDHKFDPISTEDYYALAGVFASTRLAERPLITAADYKPVAGAKQNVNKLTEQLKKLRAKKPQSKDVQQQIRSLEQRIATIKKATPNYDAPLANAVDDESLYVVRAGATPQSGTRLEYKPQPRDLRLFIRGNPNKLGPVVPRRFLRVLSKGKPEPFTQGSGRLELAQSVVRDAGPLAARVIVNRIWLGHFGRGLVETPSNFGVQGASPSHPDLLEDLAARFVENAWSIKWLHREIVLSATYRQSSATQPANQKQDPDNRWLWRMNRRRLDVEAWRDAMLAVSGELTGTIGGPSQKLEDMSNHRRTLYGTIHRRDMSAMLRLHDFPDATSHSPRRIHTTTSLQGLFVLNSPLMMARSAALARRVTAEFPGNTQQQVRRAYRLLFGREATNEGVELAVEFLAGGTQSPVTGWQLYAQVLLGSNEFLFID